MVTLPFILNLKGAKEVYALKFILGDNHDHDPADTDMYWNFGGGSGCVLSAADSVVSNIHLDCKPPMVQGFFEPSRSTRRNVTLK